MTYIYLDNNATTQLDNQVLKAMLVDLKNGPYNPSSIHSLGKKGNCLLIEARTKIASLLKVKKEEIIFTSGGTEALNLLIKNNITGHVITTDTEHASIYNVLKKDFDVTFLKTNLGIISSKEILQAIKPKTKAIVIAAVNSETGAYNDIEEVANIALEKNLFLIIDAVALLGKKDFKVPKGVSAMVFSAHKIHGPKGIGFVYLNSTCNFKPFFYGGYQEYNKRAGTENLSGILGLTKALEMAYDNLNKNIKKTENLRDFFETELLKKLNISIIKPKNRICNISNIAFLNIDAEDLLIKLDLNKVIASHGSACMSHSMQISRVLLNIGLKPDIAKSCIRFSFSKFNTKPQIQKAINIIISCVKALS